MKDPKLAKWCPICRGRLEMRTKIVEQVRRAPVVRKYRVCVDCVIAVVVWIWKRPEKTTST